MNVADLRALFDYGAWANRRLFASLAPLSDEQLTRKVAGSYGSIRNTFVHALSAEWGWIERCGGAPRGAKLDPANYPTLASLVQLQDAVERHGRALLATLRDADLTRVVEFKLGDAPPRALRVERMLHHAANHGVHHRGQIALLARELGVAPGDVDLLLFDLQAAPGAPR